MIAWRICKAKREATALSGEGAAKYPGRWNSAGRRVVYLGESRSLAALEALVHTEDLSLLNAISWIVIPVEFDDALVSEPGTLPVDWRSVPPVTATRQLGDAWIDGQLSMALRVPSVVTKGEFNYLLNPGHRDFLRVKMGVPEPFHFDKRIGQPR